MRQREEGKVDLSGGGRVVGPEGTIAVRDLWVNLAQYSPGMGVGAQINQVEVVVTIDQLDELTPGIPGGTKNGSADHEPKSIRICGWERGLKLEA